MKQRTRAGARLVAAFAGLGVIGLATVAVAQLGLGGANPREKLRERYNPGRGITGDLGDAFRKLRSDEAEERLEGTRALVGSDDPQVVPALLAGVTDTDKRVRVKAIDELGNQKATDATPVLVQQLFLRETDTIVQQRVLAALGKIADPRSTMPICEFLSRDIDASTRGTAIFALGEIGDKNALDTLSAFADDPNDPTTRRLAQEAVRKIRYRAPPAVELFPEEEKRRR
jgi:HEAT repeat protein